MSLKRFCRQSWPKYIGTNKQVHIRQFLLTPIKMLLVCAERLQHCQWGLGRDVSFKHCFQLCCKTCSKYFCQDCRFSKKCFVESQLVYSQTKFSVLSRGPRLWNKLLDQQKSLDHKTSFKKSIKLPLLSLETELRLF